MKHLVSVSGGKDSTATLAYALETCDRADVLGAFADTGNEHPAVYDYVDYLQQRTGVPIRHLKRDLSPEWWHRRDYVRDVWPTKLVEKDGMSRDHALAVVRLALDVLEAGPTGNPYLDLCIIKGRFPSRRAQFCTQWLKTEPLTEYALELIADHGVVWSWQGVRMDESDARRKRHHISGHMCQQFQVVGDGLFIHRPILRWTSADVFRAHMAAGLLPNPLYSQGCDRVGCMPCINAGKDEILNIAKRWPEHIDRVEQWESIVARVSKRGLSTFFHSPGDSSTARQRGNVRAIVEWSQTQRGGQLLDMFRVHDEPEACASSYGLCEGVAA